MDKLQEIANTKNLYEAWRKVRANRGAAGIDSVSIREFESELAENLEELSRRLQSESYLPMPARFVKMTKANGMCRELAILTVRDRVAQRAVLDAYENLFESEMSDCNFAFRPGRNVEMAIQQIIVSRANGNWWTVEADIKNFFDSIDRDVIVKEVSDLIQDERIITLISKWIDAGILTESWWFRGQRKIAEMSSIVGDSIADGFENVIEQQLAGNRFSQLAENPDYSQIPYETGDFSFEPKDPFETIDEQKQSRRKSFNGLAQDAFWLAISHRRFLASFLGARLLGIGGLAAAGIFLAPKLIGKYREFFNPRKGILQGSPLSPVLANLYLTTFDRYLDPKRFKLVRYCDDFVIACRSRSDAEEALDLGRRFLKRRNLELHPEKTRILSPDDTFEFLGYKFLSNGFVQPPPTANKEMAQKIRNLALDSKRRLRNTSDIVKDKIAKGKNFKITKLNFHSWREFIERFGGKE